MSDDRRGFLACATAAGLVLMANTSSGAKPREPKKDLARQKPRDIPPTEDLMREHGILHRVLLVYDEAGRRLAAEDASVLPVVASAASIVHRFVEGYHEKLEEQLVFPKLEKTGKLLDLTKILRVQHAAARKVTKEIIKAAQTGKSDSADHRRGLVADMQRFARMYGAHAAWEDTELFPVYREQFTEAELGKLGEQFEDQEHKLLGSGGFEGSLKEVVELEKALGVYDLAKYTPT